ncbi:hypothetical protein G9A89_004110 [Geosiphon pyriformis]|nr:hypothetical protein G9A89_004110 [Geosiphon pyriformis]
MVRTFGFGVSPLNICGSNDFVGANSLSVYMDGSLKNLGMVDCRTSAAAFFENINLGLGVSVHGLLLSTLMELQTIVLALECMSAAHSVHLFSDSQMALDACRSESDLMCSDFYNWYWVEHQHIRNVIHSKNLKVKWHKVKGHSGIPVNDCANSIANTASLSGWYLFFCVSEHFLLMDGGVVSSNSRHFVCDVFHAVCHAHWEVSSGSGFLDGNLHSDVNWFCSFRVWHPDLHMATGFTSRLTADTRIYLMKALHCQLSMAVRKHIYNKCYPSVLNNVWLVCAKHCAFMEKNGLILIDGSIPILVSGLALGFSAGVIRLLDLVSSFVGGSVPVLAGLVTWSGVKTKWLISVHSHSVSYKKLKKSAIVDNVVKTLAGSLILIDMVTDSNKSAKS